ncbi:DUF4365 domain-containing protein [Lentzea sp. NPDC004782]|uniref:DUF4365 domain-containing protein n=1 Tax=Lentzea sp. NPDC004782 TaxID=3154458 RepID=UPI0033AB1B68
MGPASDRVGRSGVHGVASIVLDGLGWKFREHHESDWGVDAIIEIADNDQPTGRLIALQIKAGTRVQLTFVELGTGLCTATSTT